MSNPLEMLKIAFKHVAIESVGSKEQKQTSYVKPESNMNYPLISKRYGTQYGSFYMYFKNGEGSQILKEILNFKMNGYVPLEPNFSKSFTQIINRRRKRKKREITIFIYFNQTFLIKFIYWIYSLRT